MASRGHEGSPLPSVTSPTNDNKPDGRGAAPHYLDFEGNIRPSDSAECLSVGGVTGREARRPRDAAKSPKDSQEASRARADADIVHKYNSFNYWRRRLPDVTSELRGKHSRRLDVNGNSKSASVIGDDAVPSAKPTSEHTQIRPRSHSRSLSPKPGRSPRPGTFVLLDSEVGESISDPEPHTGRLPRVIPLSEHHLDLALRRHIDLDDDDDVDEEQQLHLARLRLKAGSCDYSR